MHEKRSPSTDVQLISRETADEYDPVALQKAFRFAAWSSVILVSRSPCTDYFISDDYLYAQLLIMIIIIPLPLFFAQTIFGVRGLTAWVVIGIIWAFISAFAVVLYPLWESREALSLVFRGIVKVGTMMSASRIFELIRSLGRLR